MTCVLNFLIPSQARRESKFIMVPGNEPIQIIYPLAYTVYVLNNYDCINLTPNKPNYMLRSLFKNLNNSDKDQAVGAFVPSMEKFITIFQIDASTESFVILTSERFAPCQKTLLIRVSVVVFHLIGRK